MAVATLLVLALTAAACSRSDDEADTGDSGGGTDTTAATDDGGGSRLANGEFGDLGTVCQDGDSGTATETGMTADEIHVGTLTDKGAEVRAGLNKEMYDTAVAFAKWCNDNGGINGRQIVVDDLDAKLTEYGQRISEACQDDFFLVGGGAVFDNQDNGARVDCGLPNIAGYVVNPEARVAELQAQPLPNPVYSYAAQNYRRQRELHPDATKYGILWVDIAGVSTVHEQVTEAVTAEGYNVVYDQTYAPIGETGWRTFVQNMREKDVQAMELIGEPENMAALLNAMATEGWSPEVVTLQPNMIDQKFADEAKASAPDNAYARSSFPTFDMADDVPAIADYLELMDTYNPDGKYPALLGAQGLSGWLLFAKSAVECGTDLSRQCVIDKAVATTGWTGGGLHAPTDPKGDTVATCGILVKFTTDGFEYDEEATDPTDGIFNCDDANSLELEGDYGVPRPGA
ncbi:MAG TPA: ABC transporter substrate-binding protein [Acidimicrobiales bacterium]|nr:ABC transporter substrate-binding protein [Acidimicrobiales bacterium]